MRIAYLSPGHPVHDEAFTSAIRVAGHGVTVHRIPIGADADETAVEAVRAALRERPDLVHAGPVQDVAALVADIGGVPLVTASWGFDLLRPEERPGGRARAAETLARSAAVLVDCAAVRAVALELGADPDGIVQLPWGVDLSRFRPMAEDERRAARRGAGLDDRFVFVAARSLEPLYGMDLVIEAFCRAAAVTPGIALLLIGGGSQEAALRERIGRAGLDASVRFIGAVAHADLGAWLGLADAYVSASHIDGSSVTLLEAMALGVPPIVSDVGGNREWVDGTTTGWHFADGGLDALVERMVAVAGSSPDDRRRVSAAVRARVERDADWSANVPRLLAAYERVARERS